MNPLVNMPISEALSRVKRDLKSVHGIVKKGLDLTTQPEIEKLSSDILNCFETLSQILQEPLKTDLLGVVEDLDDYSLDSPQEERHQFQNFINNNLKSVIERLEHFSAD